MICNKGMSEVSTCNVYYYHVMVILTIFLFFILFLCNYIYLYLYIYRIGLNNKLMYTWSIIIIETFV